MEPALYHPHKFTTKVINQKKEKRRRKKTMTNWASMRKKTRAENQGAKGKANF